VDTAQDPVEDEFDALQIEHFVDMGSSCSNSSSESDLEHETNASSENSKGKRLRRRGKLGHILGEANLPQFALQTQNSGKVVSKDDRKSRRRRANKLEKVFGEVPPNMSEAERRTFEHRRSIASVFVLLSNKSAIANVVDFLSNVGQDKGEPQDGFELRGNFARSQGGKEYEPSITSISTHDTFESVNSNLPANAKRKKTFDKLNKFFGDSITPASLIEQGIISKLEKSITESITTDDPSLPIIRADLAALREQVKSITENWQEGGPLESSSSSLEKETDVNSSGKEKKFTDVDSVTSHPLDANESGFLLLSNSSKK
jgi:hypothetical protein